MFDTITMKKTRNSLLGFTLMEIVVVVAIVALLFAAGVTSYAKIRVSSRDSIRKSDLLNIRGALEQYRNIVGTYPPATLSTLTPDYLPKEPMDPRGNCPYTYLPTDSNTKYTICADLEGDNPDTWVGCPDICDTASQLTNLQ